jgi:hypothetical protein
LLERSPPERLLHAVGTVTFLDIETVRCVQVAANDLALVTEVLPKADRRTCFTVVAAVDPD